jgi:probable rRNA maturation factor
MMQITITNNSPTDISSELIAQLEQLASSVLAQEDAPKDSRIDITFVNATQIAEMNAEYRQIAEPTDVLSFAIGDDEDFWEQEPDGSVILGDIVVAPEVVAQRLDKYDLDFCCAMRLMVVHGVLHLLGYDHIKEKDAHIMEQLEDKYV